MGYLHTSSPSFAGLARPSLEGRGDDLPNELLLDGFRRWSLGVSVD
jgi:hypothetical protein